MPFYSGIAIACLLVIAETVLTTGQGCEDIACPAIWSPVCGADGKTYSNQCAACGVDVACEGECPCSGGMGEFCGDKKCNLKCKAGEKCVENEEVQCVQAPCCPRWTCQQDPCLGKPCGTFCDTSSMLLTGKSSGLLPAILPAIRYCQPDGTCGFNSKPNCTEELKEEGESCGSCFCPPTYNAGTCKPGLTCVHHPLIADLPGTCTRTNCETCELMVQGQKCGQDILAALDGGPLRMNCTDCCRASSQCAEWRCDAGGLLCQKTCPSGSSCGVKLCSSPEGCPLVKNNLLTTLPQLNKQFLVSFEFLATQFINGWQNVIHFTENGDCCDVGKRVPAFWVSGFGQLYPRFAVNGNGDYGILTTKKYTVNEWHRVEFSQALENNKYIYKVIIDGVKQIEVENKQPKIFSNVKVYAADPFYNSLKGSLKNLFINTEHP